MPASKTRPFPMKVLWVNHLNSSSARKLLGMASGSGRLTVDEYNAALGTQYRSLREIPFPIPDTAPAKLRACWNEFVQKQYPSRLIEVRLTPALHARYRAFVQERFHGNLQRCNDISGTDYAAWDAVRYSATQPAVQTQAGLWLEFLRQLPASARIPHSAEQAYQHFLLEKYGSVQAVNEAYGWQLAAIEQAQMPFDMAYLVTYHQHQGVMFLDGLLKNYRFVVDYLILRGRALGNTLIFIALTLIAALTVNPLAAYALSRFQMRQTPAIILFMLATMAFPAAVTMIPGYLLMRDLHLLNTYAALVLPSVANGMSIFLLKGFFDSLPPELYEAAALDGAQEWQMFLRITLPLSKPILAVIALNSFLFAYNSWEWALVVCQKQEMWTLAVWLYQFTTQMQAMNRPETVMAAFIVASLPVFLVFTLCQNIILRGIILPQMK
jgi:multiple sugar transport system permease protein